MEERKLVPGAFKKSIKNVIISDEDDEEEEDFLDSLVVPFRVQRIGEKKKVENKVEKDGVPDDRNNAPAGARARTGKTEKRRLRI